MTSEQQAAFSFYPTREQIDNWASGLLRKAENITVDGIITEDNPIVHAFGNGPNALENRFVHFQTGEGHTFWGYWQRAIKSPAPLLINLPGYGG